MARVTNGRRILIVLLLVIASLPVFFLSILVIETRQKMRRFEAVSPGTKTNEIVRLFGKPSKVALAGDAIPGTRRHFELRTTPDGMLVYFYGREGLPYFDVYYLVDAKSGTVSKTVVENLWW
jgi:hypothetical protein